jgi:hypothetical protein
MVFDVKYDLRHKARIVAGSNLTVNDKVDIYSGVVRMDTVRIGFFLGELYGLSCCACDIVHSFFYGKNRRSIKLLVLNLEDCIILLYICYRIRSCTRC